MSMVFIILEVCYINYAQLQVIDIRSGPVIKYMLPRNS